WAHADMLSDRVRTTERDCRQYSESTRMITESNDCSPAGDEQPTTRNPRGGPLPARARGVVIGGGDIRDFLPHQPALMGWSDVLLLERDRLTSGTTWHAAGLMATFGSTSQTSTELRQYTWDLYSRLEAETGLATGLRQCGLIELAIEPGRLEEYRRT